MTSQLWARAWPCVMWLAGLIVLGGHTRVAQAGDLVGFSPDGRLVFTETTCAPLPQAATFGEMACQPGSARVEGPLIRQASGSTGWTASTDAGHIVIRKAGQGVIRYRPRGEIAGVGAMYANDRQTLVAVEFTTTALGASQKHVIGFRVAPATPLTPSVGTGTGPGQPSKSTASSPDATAGPTAAALQKATRGNARKRIAAWAALVASYPACAECIYEWASELAATKSTSAVPTLARLASLATPAAEEWLIAARFDARWKRLLPVPEFRNVTRLGQPATTVYARVMGLGGRWIFQGTPCESPTVELTLTQRRTFRLVVTSRCGGAPSVTTFQGTWREEEHGLGLVLPQAVAADGGPSDKVPCAVRPVGDEPELACVLDADLEVRLLPVRR